MSRLASKLRLTRNMKVIEEFLEPLAGKRILDVGCGRGPLCRALVRRHALPTGIDVSREALTHARALCPEVKFLECSASSLPFADGSFDGAVFLNSLHHVPQDEMAQALREALRCVVVGDRVLILEPLAEGPYFEVMQPIHDETVIRSHALEAIDDLCRERDIILHERFKFETKHSIGSADGVMRRSVEVDPRRRANVRLHGPAIRKLFERHAIPTDDRFTLKQPMLAVALSQGMGSPER